VWEFVAENLILVPLLLRSSRQDAWTVTESATGPSPRLRALDTAIRASGWVTLVVLAVTLLYKHLTERLVYVLQPCHVMTGVLAWLCFAQPAAGAGACGRAPSAHLPSILFNVVCLHWVFGCWLAILAPGAWGIKGFAGLAHVCCTHVCPCTALQCLTDTHTHPLPSSTYVLRGPWCYKLSPALCLLWPHSVGLSCGPFFDPTKQTQAPCCCPWSLSSSTCSIGCWWGLPSCW
jgi:hypothetical protein